MAADKEKSKQARDEALKIYTAMGFDDKEYADKELLKAVCDEGKVAVISFKSNAQDSLGSILGTPYMFQDGDRDDEPKNFDKLLKQAVFERGKLMAKYGLTPNGHHDHAPAREQERPQAHTQAPVTPEQAAMQPPALVPQPEPDFKPASELPAVQKPTGMVVGSGPSISTAVRVNGIPIPNEFLFWYGTRQGGKVVGAKPYINIKGVEYLADKMDILYKDPRIGDPAVSVDKLVPAVDIVIVKSPWVENELGPKGVTIVRGIVRGKDGRVWTDLGTATPDNTTSKQKKYPLEQAIARARGRALRVATSCNMCTIEEADLEVAGDKVLVKGLPNEKGEVIDAEFAIINEFGGAQ